MTPNEQHSIDLILKQGKRITELEKALEDIYLNTFPLENSKEWLFFSFINNTIRGVIKEDRKAWIESCH